MTAPESRLSKEAVDKFYRELEADPARLAAWRRVWEALLIPLLTSCDQGHGARRNCL
ncbi:MAG TPA: hypothetical protein VFW96_17095 [Thermomicrobiales bacterium]|nr:hypothetical protein [Thermomicrobiales bacterium]